MTERVAGGENTRETAGELEGQTGKRQQPWLRDYWIRYYLSSDKLNPVN